MSRIPSSRVVGLVLAGLGGALVFPGAVRADEPPPHRQPPQEAFDACSGKKEGDDCTVTFRDKQINGVCEAFKDSGLACRPSGPPPSRP
jgi:hypothetical protein